MNTTVQANKTPTLSELVNEMESVRGDLMAIVRLSHFQIGDLETQLESNRGSSIGPGAVSLKFSLEAIDATLWLGSEIWDRIRKLDQRFDSLQVSAELLEEAMQ